MAFVKGQSGNPAGGQKHDKIWTEAIRLAVHEAHQEGPEGRKKLRALAEKLVSKALEGDIAAMKEIGDRLDGKPAQTTDLNITRRDASDLSDGELIDIARGGSDGAVEPTNGTTELPKLH